jgi:hypothetical protein
MHGPRPGESKYLTFWSDFDREFFYYGLLPLMGVPGAAATLVVVWTAWTFVSGYWKVRQLAGLPSEGDRH